MVSLIVLLLITSFSLGCTGISRPEGWSAGVISNSTLFIGTMEGTLRALDIHTGETIWTFDLRGDSKIRSIYGTPILEGDRLFFGGYEGQIYSLNLNGQEVWDREVGDGSPIVGGPAIANDKVLIGSSDGNLYAFDKLNGTPIWKFHTGNRVWSTPSVVDGIAYFGSLDHNIYAVNTENGKEMWRFTTKGAVTATPLVSNGRVYVGAFDSVFYVLDALTGKAVNRFEGSKNWFWGSAIADDNTVYAPSLDGNLYALDMHNMTPIWVIRTGSSIIGSPVIVGDRIALSALDGKIRIAKLSNGEDLTMCNIGAKLRSSMTINGRVLFFSSGDHSIRAIHVKENGNPDEKWVHFSNQDDPVPWDWARSC